MNIADTYVCPITGTVLKNGMKQKEILGVDHVYTYCPLEHYYLDGCLHLVKGQEHYFVSVQSTQLWSWEFVEKVRKIVLK